MIKIQSKNFHVSFVAASEQALLDSPLDKSLSSLVSAKKLLHCAAPERAQKLYPQPVTGVQG